MARGVADAGLADGASPATPGRPFEDDRRTGVAWWPQVYVTADRPTVPAAARARRRRRRPRGGAHRGHPGRRHEVRRRGTDRLGRARARLAAGQLPAGLRRRRRRREGHRPRPAGRRVAGAQVTGLPVVVKGVLRPDDARRCVDAGAAAVWVSNHGGRQLDQAAATADCLAAVVAEVGDACEVYVDGGVRTGRHALAALALGARAVFLGRPPLYALAVDGAAGVDAAPRRARRGARGGAAARRLRAATRAPGPGRDLLRTAASANDTDVVRERSARPREPRPRTPKPPLTCANANVTGATPTRFDVSGGVYVMFSLSPGSGGTQGREAGRPAPRRNPSQITSTEVARVRATAASDRLGRCGAEGAGASKTPI